MSITSKEINLTQLSVELGGKGLIADFTDIKNKIILPADGVVLSDTELDAAIAAHIAVDEVKTLLTAKAALLKKLGITEDEARLLLA